MNNFNLDLFPGEHAHAVCVVLALVATLTLGIMAIRRSARPKRTGILEGIRLLCVAYVCTMLLGPEWRTIQQSDLQPEIAIIWDESLSMTTEDVERPDNIAGDEKILTRKELVNRLRELEFWNIFESDGRNRITQMSFGAPPENSNTVELSMSGTDVNEALNQVLDSGQNLRAAIFLGDGDWNIGSSPVAAAQQFRLKGAPLYTLAIGSNKRVHPKCLLTPDYGIVGENIQIPSPSSPRSNAMRRKSG